jgi:hypothetical protein
MLLLVDDSNRGIEYWLHHSVPGSVRPSKLDSQHAETQFVYRCKTVYPGLPLRPVSLVFHKMILVKETTTIVINSSLYLSFYVL